jgi:hypothetical protein
MQLSPTQLAADENTSPQKLAKLAKQSIELARIIAQNPHVASELLIELAESKDRLVCQYVASNPNTTIEVLEKLGQEFPEAVTGNPIFNLLTLINPDSRFIHLSLARSSTTSSAM